MAAPLLSSDKHLTSGEGNEDNHGGTILGRMRVELYADKVITNLGNGGFPAHLPSEELKTLSKQHFDDHSFDSVLSDRISLNRHLNDFRGEK